MRDEERQQLEPWAFGFTRCFGAAPMFTPMELPATSATSAPVEGDLFRVTFPMAVEPKEVLGGTGHFQQGEALAAHMRAFGFAWGDDGRIFTAPTPATFNALLPRLAGEDLGYRLHFQIEDSPTMSLGPWLLRYMDGFIPIHVANAPFYERVDVRTGKMRWHFTTLAHDLTVHALNYQLVPRRLAVAIGARIRDALPERAATWDAPRATAPMTLAYFYDNDFNRYCYAVWICCDRPADFAPRFEAHFPELLAALDVRIAETREGKGDVASGDSNDMPPLAPTEFKVTRPRSQQRR